MTKRGAFSHSREYAYSLEALLSYPITPGLAQSIVVCGALAQHQRLIARRVCPLRVAGRYLDVTGRFFSVLQASILLHPATFPGHRTRARARWNSSSCFPPASSASFPGVSIEKT